MATKADIIYETAQRLGNTTTAFQNLLKPIFEQVRNEMAATGGLVALRASTNFTITAGVATYNLLTITGQSTPPLHVLRVWVASYPYPHSVIRKRDGVLFELAQARNTATGRPRFWRLHPNPNTLEFTPTPDSSSAGQGSLLYVKPPVGLADNAVITDVEQEYRPYLIAGILTYAAPLLDETYAEQKAALTFYQQGLALMKTRATLIHNTTTQTAALASTQSP